MGIRIEQPPQVSPATLALIDGLVNGNHQRMAKAEMPRKSNIRLQFADPNSTDMDDLKPRKKRGPKAGSDIEESFSKSLLNMLDGGGKSIERLAFETDPRQNNSYAGVYIPKKRLIPDEMLKRMAIQDDLVATIVNTRSAQIQSFGRPQPDRFSSGFKLVPDESILDKMSNEQKDELQKRIDKAQKTIVTCGYTKGWKDKERMTFAQYLGMSARNAVTVGRIATEIVWTDDTATGEKVFHSFRPIDAGTIYKVVPESAEAESVRAEALRLLEQLKNKDLEPERFKKNEYAWVQVINGSPIQAFTEDECVVHNFFPVSDIEMDGYPVTPLDTAIAAVTTHINITTHNRLYFQSGRAARGMIVIKSEDVDDGTITRIKHQFQASINNASNSWRMPVFAVGPADEMEWTPIDSGSRDMEFQYLSDTNARVIMSAFQISPEELPGYQHLSRGTNNQALSESNNEYKLEAARDVGIRPLIAQFEDFLNARILPLIDQKLAEFCVVKFVGLDSETPEKENVRIQESMGVHMTFDEVLQAVEKKPVGIEMGGQLPLNALYKQNLDAYFTVGEILEHFCGRKDASKDPALAYRRDPFYFQQVQLQMQQQQMQMQAQQQQAQAAQGQDPNAQQGQDPNAQQGQQPQQDGQQAQAPDLTNGIDQVISMMSKSEAQLPPSRRRLLEQQRATVNRFMLHMEKDLEKLSDTILDVAELHLPEKE
jgi:hypothetical protein